MLSQLSEVIGGRHVKPCWYKKSVQYVPYSIFIVKLVVINDVLPIIFFYIKDRKSFKFYNQETSAQGSSY